MEDVLKQILGEVSKINLQLSDVTQRLDNVDQRLDKFEQRFDEVDERFNKVDERFNKVDKRLDTIENKIDAVIEQTAMLTEFRTETMESIAKLQDDIKFLMYKETENEKNIYLIKQAQK